MRPSRLLPGFEQSNSGRSKACLLQAGISPYSRAAAADFHRLPVHGVSGEFCGAVVLQTLNRSAPFAEADGVCVRPPKRRTLIHRGLRITRQLLGPAQRHARTPIGTEIHVQRSVKNLLQQIPVVNFGRRANPQTLPLVHQNDPVGKFRSQI